MSAMTDKQVIRTTSARIPTKYGDFQLCYYTNSEDDKAHLALYLGNVENAENVLTRVHSECFTGDVLGSLRCDCGEQLDEGREPRLERQQHESHTESGKPRQKHHAIGIGRLVDGDRLDADVVHEQHDDE